VVTGLIKALVGVAVSEKDEMTEAFLQWYLDEISYERQAEMVRERISAILQILTTMEGTNPNENRGAARLLGAAGEDAEQALLLIKMVRGEL
jgi:hypothetical protein